MLDYRKDDPRMAATTSLGTASRTAVAQRSATVRRVAPVLLVVFDLAVVYLAFLAAYWVRYDLRLGPAIRDQLGFDAYLPLLLPLFALMILTLWAKGAYRLRLGNEMQDDMTAALSAAVTSVATIIVLTAMLQQYQYSRGVIVYLFVALVVFLVLGRFAFRSVMAYLYRHGLGVKRLLVVGATDVGKMIMQGVAGRRDLGYELVGFVHTRVDMANGRSGPFSPSDFGRFRNLGYASDVPEIVTRERVDEVIIALPAAAHEEIWPILQQCESDGIGFKIVPDLFELSLGRVQVDDLAGIPLLDVQEPQLRRLKLALKQAADWTIGLFVAVFFSPVLLLTAILIKLESRGPILFAQERVGHNGRTFTCYKFRSMRDGGDELINELSQLHEGHGPEIKLRSDPRCTRVGRVIRRHSIDELPQLWNVFKREMSLVGPRPALPQEIDKYEPWHQRRLHARPGITGMWQVSGRSDLSFDEKAMMDIYYIENWSLLLDLKILVRTVAAMVGGRGAY